MELTIETIAKAIAQANGHPDPDGYAAQVKGHFDPQPEPSPEPEPEHPAE